MFSIPSDGVVQRRNSSAVSLTLPLALQPQDCPTSQGTGAGTCLSARQEKTAKALMGDNLSSGMLISAVAKACFLSRSHFSRAFKQSTGCSPREWIRRARLLRAVALLERSDCPVAQVSVECGFADQPHFTRTFVKEFGMSPGRWRAQRAMLKNVYCPTG